MNHPSINQASRHHLTTEPVRWVAPLSPEEESEDGELVVLASNLFVEEGVVVYFLRIRAGDDYSPCLEVEDVIRGANLHPLRNTHNYVAAGAKQPAVREDCVDVAVEAVVEPPDKAGTEVPVRGELEGDGAHSL